MVMSEMDTGISVGAQEEKKEEVLEALEPDEAVLEADNDSDSQLRICDLGEAEIDDLLAPDNDESDVKGTEVSAEDLLGTDTLSANSSAEHSQCGGSTEESQPMIDLDELKPINLKQEHKDLTMEEFFGGISAATLIADDPEVTSDEVSAKKTKESMECTDMDDDDIVVLENEKNEAPRGVDCTKHSIPEDNDCVLLSDDEDVASGSKEAPKTSLTASAEPKHRQIQQMLRFYLERKSPTEQAMVATRLDMQTLKLNMATAEEKINTAVREFNMRTEIERQRMQTKLDIANKAIKELQSQLQQKNTTYGSFGHQQQNGQFKNMNKPRFVTRSPANPIPTNFVNGNHRMQSPQSTSSYRAIAPRPAPSNATYSVHVTPRNSTPIHSRSTLAVPAVPSMVPTSSMKTKITINIDKVPATPSGIHDPFDARPLPDYPNGVNRLPRDQVNVVLKTEYENFLLTKKVHGTITYPTGFANPEGKAVRLYYFIESMNKTWQYSETAQLSTTGSTKFVLSFAQDQKLYSGDRVTFIAYLFLDQSTKFVSDRVFFKLRPPPGFKRSGPDVVDLQ